MEHKLIVRNLERRRKKCKLTKKEAASIMGLGYSTFRYNLDHPKEFRIGELMAFCDYVGIGLKELLKY